MKAIACCSTTICLLSSVLLGCGGGGSGGNNNVEPNPPPNVEPNPPPNVEPNPPPNPNHAPVITNLTAVPNPIPTGQTMTVTATASDPDGNTLSYTWTVPAGYTLQSGQGTSQIVVLATQYPAKGDIEVQVSDGSLVATSSIAVSTKGTDWTTFGGDMQRTGFNPAETVLSPNTVPNLRLYWSFDLGGASWTQPTMLSGVAMPDGQQRDLIYVATLLGKFYALDSATGKQIWEVNLPSVQIDVTQCEDFAASNGWVGVIATPTIDQANQRIFVVAGDGTLHALNVATGSELPGWPLQLLDQANAAPKTFVYGSPTLDIQSNQLYITTASACDIEPYHGQVIQVNVDPQLAPQVVARWFPTGASGPNGGGIWGPGGVSLEPNGMYLYAATGNALIIPENPPYGDSIVKLSPQSGGNALAPVAANTPSLPGALTGEDVDFGATPLLYQASGCPAQLAAMNKSGILFIYDRDKIAEGSRQQIDISTGAGDFIGIPAYDSIHQQIYLGNSLDSEDGTYKHGIIALSVKNCSVNPIPAWQQQVGDTGAENPVIPPTVANGVVYYVSGVEGILYAFKADSGELLWKSNQITQGIFAAPTVINGQVFVVTNGHNIYAFGL